ncbi:MAG: hypothetical protein IPI89_03490 [Propionivibrio sp.]|nr:hypothetical protein [Propionivibrio sp.]
MTKIAKQLRPDGGSRSRHQRAKCRPINGNDGRQRNSDLAQCRSFTRKAEVKAYYSRMVGGEGAILKKYETKVSLSAPAHFYGDVAVADGKADDAFYPHKRDLFHLDSRWSSTLGKIDGNWRIITLHLSANVFTNPLMAEAERWIWFAGVGGVLLGSLAVFTIGYLRRRQ